MSKSYTSKPVFASTFTYAYTKLRGQAWVDAMLPAGEGFPGAETLANLRDVCPDIVLFQSGQTLITKARSMAAREFLKSEADLWVTWDDDILAPKDTLRAVMSAASEAKGLAAAPCVLRGGGKVNFRMYDGEKELLQNAVTSMGVKVLAMPVLWVGFGLAVIHRKTVEQLTSFPQVWVTADEGEQPYPSLFIERVHRGAWCGDDVAFCLLMHEQGLVRQIVLNAPIVHAGQGCYVDEHGEVHVDPSTSKSFEAP